MNEVNLPAIEPVTDEDAHIATLGYVNDMTMIGILEQDRRRVAERQAPEIERLRAEVAQADADYNDAITLAQMNLDLLKAAEAEVAALKAAGAQKDGALGICRAMLSVVHDFGQFTRSTKVAIGVAESALSTDAGKGWIDATGAVEGRVQKLPVPASGWAGGTSLEHVTIPREWAGDRVLIVRVAK